MILELIEARVSTKKTKTKADTCPRVVGLGGLIQPRALGVGYDIIEQLLKGDYVPSAEATAYSSSMIISPLQSGARGSRPGRQPDPSRAWPAGARAVARSRHERVGAGA